MQLHALRWLWEAFHRALPQFPGFEKDAAYTLGSELKMALGGGPQCRVIPPHRARLTTSCLQSCLNQAPGVLLACSASCKSQVWIAPTSLRTFKDAATPREAPRDGMAPLSARQKCCRCTSLTLRPTLPAWPSFFCAGAEAERGRLNCLCGRGPPPQTSNPHLTSSN